MRYLSLCSGIEAASCAWHPLGWTPVAFSEIDAFPSAVLAHRFPSVPNWGDMTKFQEWPDADVDVLVGGTPCQSFSVAGLRKGLADPRGNLMLTYLAIAERYRPRWLVWENVPGVLSSNRGRDFGTFLGGLGELGYGFAYRVLDAQYVRVESHPRAVPQRRRRVFVVGHLGDWRRAAAVLFERESLRGHPAPRREAGERPAPSLAARTRGGGGLGTDFECDGRLIPDVVGALSDGAHMGGGRTGKTPTPDASLPSVANVLTRRMHKGINTTLDEGQTLIPTIGGGFDVAGTMMSYASGGGQNNSADLAAAGYMIPVVAHTLDTSGRATEDGTGRGVPLPLAIRGRGDGRDLEWHDEGVANAILTPNGGRDGMGVGAIAFNPQAVGKQTTLGANSSHAATLSGSQTQAIAFDLAQITSAANRTRAEPGLPASSMAKGSRMHVAQTMAVRRLTPLECEKLQGFPDGWTDVPYRGKSAADGPRYRAIGNSMAVNVMRWIGERIAQVAEIDYPSAPGSRV